MVETRISNMELGSDELSFSWDSKSLYCILFLMSGCLIILFSVFCASELSFIVNEKLN